jgi:hypothetical protein
MPLAPGTQLGAYEPTHAVYETAMTYIPGWGNSLASDLFTSIP